MRQIREFYRDYPITAGLLVMMVAVYLVMNLVFPFYATSNAAILTFGGLFGALIRVDSSQWWRIISSNFVHIGLEHLLMNGFSLYIVGKIAEQVWSKRDYLILFLLSGIFGGLLTIALAPQVLSAGASSSIFGLFAGVAIMGYFGHNLLLKQMGRSFQTLIVVNLLFNLFMPSVNIWGHLGGAIGGALCAVILPNRVDPYAFSKQQRQQALLALLGSVVLLLVLFYLR